MVGIQVCTKYGRRGTAMGVRHRGFITALYQILDVADGKQDRKSGNSSPLGLLFDHICDALNVVISACTFVSTMRLEAMYWVLSVLL